MPSVKLLYKYFSANNASLFLKKPELWFTHPRLFNDPLEFVENDKSEPTFDEFHCAVASLSDTIIEPLLWGLYADKGAGVAIGLDVSRIEGLTWEPVCYTSRASPSATATWLSKTSKWEFEQEWRSKLNWQTAKKVANKIRTSARAYDILQLESWELDPDISALGFVGYSVPIPKESVVEIVFHHSGVAKDFLELACDFPHLTPIYVRRQANLDAFKINKITWEDVHIDHEAEEARFGGIFYQPGR